MKGPLRLIPRALTVGAAVLSFAPPAAAAPPDPPPPNASEPRPEGADFPEPLATPLEYPAGETRSALVVLELIVDPEGNVTDVALVSGEPPFADVALEAARTWKFTPARRRGRAVRSKFRYAARFEPPAPAPEVEAPALPARAAAEPVPVEVLVRGERAAWERPATVTLTREDARSVPGTFGDPLRAVEAEPGVIPIVSGLPSFFVRGAPPANVGYFIDGIEVPLLYHAFFGPSVLHPGVIDNVKLYGGAPPVEYGRFAGPVVAADVKPLARRFTGEANVRLVDAGALVEAPFGGCDGPEREGCSRGSVRLGGRYSYTGLILSALGDAQLDYWDYNGNISYALGGNDTVSAIGFGAYDFFEAGGTSDQGGGEVRFHRLGLRWDHTFAGGRTHTRVGVIGGYDSTGGVEAATSTVGNRSVRLQGEVHSELGEAVYLHAGIEGRVDDYSLVTDPLLLNFADYSRLFPERTETSAGAYVSSELRPARGIKVVPGVRADVYHDRGITAFALDPRVAAEFALGSRVTVDQSLGLAHQRPNFVPNVPGAQVADLEGGLQEALLWSSGVSWKLPLHLTASATVFRNAFFNALDPLGGKRDFSIDRTVLDRRSTISSMGLELKVKRPFSKRLGVLFSYTLSRTEQATGTDEAISGFDRPHVASLVLGYTFGSGYAIGGRAVFYSGVPELNLERRPHFTTRRRGRPYFRSDVRFEKRFRLGEHAYWGVNAEVLNVTATQEVVRLDCGVRCVERVAGPVVLPSIGVEAGF